MSLWVQRFAFVPMLAYQCISYEAEAESGPSLVPPLMISADVSQGPLDWAHATCSTASARGGSAMPVPSKLGAV